MICSYNFIVSLPLSHGGGYKYEYESGGYKYESESESSQYVG